MLRFDSRSTNPRFPAFNLPLCYAFMNLELLIECRPFALHPTSLLVTFYTLNIFNPRIPPPITGCHFNLNPPSKKNELPLPPSCLNPHSSSRVITGRLPTSLLHPAICFAYLAPIHSSFLSPECKFNPLAPSLLQVSPHHTCLPCNMLRFDSRSTNPRFPAFNLPHFPSFSAQPSTSWYPHYFSLTLLCSLSTFYGGRGRR